jgi:hypothetical protein
MKNTIDKLTTTLRFILSDVIAEKIHLINRRQRPATHSPMLESSEPAPVREEVH